MNEDKQIMNMADDIRRIRESYFGQADYLFAKKMYEDGYRKQREGEWIEITMPSFIEDDVDVFYQCSKCESTNFGKSPFCPNCGAKMKGDEGK